jgi:hypothetical protein
MTSPMMIKTNNAVLGGNKIKGGKGEKIVVTSPVFMDMGDGKCVPCTQYYWDMVMVVSVTS